MVEIDLGKPTTNATEFHYTRSCAIEAYATLERSLSDLLTLLLANDMRAAATIFNRLGNTKSRNLIIEDLIEHRYTGAYSAYWHGIAGTKDKSGLMTIIQSLDGKRNEIVHWHSVRNVTDTDDSLVLMPPSFWFRPTAPTIDTVDLLSFIEKANFAHRSLNMFITYVSEQGPPGDAAWRDTWRGIFQKPCSYPPSDTHPLFQRL